MKQSEDNEQLLTMYKKTKMSEDKLCSLQYKTTLELSDDCTLGNVKTMKGSAGKKDSTLGNKCNECSNDMHLQ